MFTYCRCKHYSFFFTHKVQEIIANYTGLFNASNDGEYETEDDMEEVQANNKGLQKYGLLNYVLKAVEVSKHPLNEVLKLPICTTLTLVQWALDKAQIEELQIKKLQKKWK